MRSLETGLRCVVSMSGVACAGLGLAISGAAQASFVGYFVSSTETSYQGRDLIVYTLTARFDGPHDTVFRAYNLSAENPDWLAGFWHKDNHGDPATNGLLSQSFGTWDPTKTGSPTANRPLDSYLTIGSVARAGNTTRSDGNWLDDNNPEKSSWDRPTLPANGQLGWYNDDSDSGQGTVGNSPDVAPTDVRLAQFVLSAGHDQRTFSLCIKYGHEYSLSDDYQLVCSSFTLGNAIPGPGAAALMALAGICTPRRRR